MKLNRRQFINLSVAGGLSSFAYLRSPMQNSSAAELGPGLFLGGGRFIDPNISDEVQFVMASTRMDGAPPELYPVNFFPHGIVIDPLNHQRLMLFEKKGPGACEIDLQAGQMTRELAPKQGCHFYGHGAFSKDGNLIFATETYLDSQQGTITVRDAKNLQLLGEFPTHGANPHDCQLFDDGKQIAITNAGGAMGSNDIPAVTYVDVSSGRLLERIELGHQRVNTGHLLLTSNLDLVVSSAPRDGLSQSDPGGVSLRPAGMVMRTMTAPEDIVNSMTGESLSIAVHEESQTVAVTNPDANLVTFWHLSRQEYLSSLSMDRPRGVALSSDKKDFILSYGAQTNLIQVSTDTLEPIPDSLVSPVYITGSHLINWDNEVARLA